MSTLEGSLAGPDAYLIIETEDYEDCFFIESDCGSEAPVRIEAKAKAYISYYQSGREQAADGIFPQVVFVADTEHRRDQLVEALGRAPAEHRRLFVSVTAKPAAGLLTNGSLVAGEQREDVS